VSQLLGRVPHRDLETFIPGLEIFLKIQTRINFTVSFLQRYILLTLLLKYSIDLELGMFKNFLNQITDVEKKIKKKVLRETEKRESLTFSQ